LPWVEGYDRGFAQRFIRESVSSWAEQRAYDFTVRTLENLDRHVANVSVWPTSVQNQVGEVGYWVRTAETGRGYGTEAAAVAIGIGFNELDLHKIVLRIAVGNKGSERIAEKLGFSYEGVLRDEVKVAGRWLDHTSWSMLASEWSVRTPALGIEDTHL
jgi:RimJ/RimL family protein N-acetyltransferase